MKKYLYAIPFIALIDPLVSFALASWVFGQTTDTMKIEPLIFCLFSFGVALALIFCAILLMTNKPINNPKAIVFLCSLVGLTYSVIGAYSLLAQPIAISSDIYTQLDAQDPDFFIRLLKSSAIQIWSISVSALLMLLFLVVGNRGMYPINHP
jgi:uncharacterized membrane protein YbhN (UPF0104 family)